MLLCKIRTTPPGQDLRKKYSSLYGCFCHHGCAHSGRLWWIKNHYPMHITSYHNEWPSSPSVRNIPVPGAGRTQIPLHPWSFPETKHHTNWTVVQIFQKLPMSSDVRPFLPLADTTSVPLAVAGRQDKPGCQLILYDLLLNSFSTFKIKLWARSSSDLIQLLPIKQMTIWPCTVYSSSFFGARLRVWSNTWSQWKHQLFCVWCIHHEKSWVFQKAGKKPTPFQKQRKARKFLKDTINLLFLFSYYAMPFILKEMVQSMICTSFSGKEDICTNNSTFTDKRQSTENAHGGEKKNHILRLHLLLWMIPWSVTMSGIPSVHLKKASNSILTRKNPLNHWCLKPPRFLPIQF